MDELLQLYAARLQRIYDDRSAGDASFLGILSEFREEYDTFRDDKHRQDMLWSEPVGEAEVVEDDTDDSDILEFHFPATDVELYAQNRRLIAEHNGRR